MGAAGFGGSFAPIVQYEKWEIHPVFPHFPYFRLCQNLSPNLLAPLCGVALILPMMIGHREDFPISHWRGSAHGSLVSAKLTEGLLEQFLSQNSPSRLKRVFQRSSLSRDHLYLVDGFPNNPSATAYAVPPPFTQGRLWCGAKSHIMHRALHRTVYRSAPFVSVR